MKQIELSSLPDIIYNLQNWKCVHKKIVFRVYDATIIWNRML